MKLFLLKYIWPLYIILIFWPLAVVLSFLIFFLTIFAALIFGEDVTTRCTVLWSWVLIKLAFVKMELRGAENYDPSKSYVIVANHASFYDIYGIYTVLTRTIRFVMKKELAMVPVFKTAVKRSGHIVIDRRNSRSSLASIKNAASKLINGTSIMFFPEGTRTKTGRLGRFRRGAFQFALEVERDVLPISISGSYNIYPSGTFIVKPGKIIYTVHPSIDITRYSKDTCDALIKRSKDTIESGIIN